MVTENLSLIQPVKRYSLYSEAMEKEHKKARRIGRIEESLVLFLMNLHVIYIACTILKKPRQILHALKKMKLLYNALWSEGFKKIQYCNGKYFRHLFAPGWPSAAHTKMIRDELLHQVFPIEYPNSQTFIFLAITRKCPLRCEHCFEWENLHHKETFSLDELKQIVDFYQQQEILQIHLSGGEPMVRLHDLLELVKYAKDKSDCFVLTSGVNLTAENAALLKQNGCKGVAVSIDHYIPEMHNSFRNNPKIFQQAVNGVKAALDAGLLTTMTVCVTREFIDGGHLYPYLDFAKQLGVHYVQLLEPRAVGHYKGKNVLLDEIHLKKLEECFIKLNKAPAYRDYPTVLYHGYHQRRIGCYTGSHSIYVDSIGDVHACPFCHTKSYNIMDMLKAKTKSIELIEVACPAFGNA